MNDETVGAAHESVDEPVVLVTVFGARPGHEVAPTECIADALAGEEHVVSHVLDLSYERAVAQLDELVRMVAPAAVVCFGVAGVAAGIRLEEVARNGGGAGGPDVDGDTAAVRTRLPLPAIADALVAAGLPVEPSEDAGTDVGNRVFHRVVTHPALTGRPAGLVHVPDPGRAGSPLDEAGIALAGRIVVDAVAAHARGEL